MSTTTATPTSRCGCRRASSSARDGVRFDTTGSDPQRRAPVNSTFAMTFSACAYALKCLIDPDLPVNDGFYRLITSTRPRARSRTARWPAAVVGGWETHDRLVEVIFRALLPAFPERLPAGTKGMMCQAGFGALDVEAGTYTCFYDTFAGGYGAPARERRPGRGAGARPEHRERADRGDRAQLPGADRAALARRGLRGPRPLPRRARAAQGLRLRPRRRRSPILADRDRSGRGASFGGHDAARRRVRPQSATAPRRGSARRSTVELEPGDVISVRTCGGGGYGPPERARPGARSARRARGQGQRRAGARRLPRRGRLERRRLDERRNGRR